MDDGVRKSCTFGPDFNGSAVRRIRRCRTYAVNAVFSLKTNKQHGYASRPINYVGNEITRVIHDRDAHQTRALYANRSGTNGVDTTGTIRCTITIQCYAYAFYNVEARTRVCDCGQHADADKICVIAMRFRAPADYLAHVPTEIPFRV